MPTPTPTHWLPRLGAASGVILALSLAIPGIIEAITGETAATSIAIGLGAAFGAPAVTALHTHHSHAAGRFGTIAHTANLIGLGLFTGVAFTLNNALYFLGEPTLPPPAATVLRLSGIAFIAGTLLFSAALIRARVFPRIPAWGYGITLTALAIAARLPDTPLTSALHILAAASIIWLCATVWRANPALT